MKNVANIIAIAIACCVSVSWSDEGHSGQLAAVVQEGDFTVGPNVQPLVEDVKLYNWDEVNRLEAEQAYKEAYPKLFATKAVIVYFGSKNCAPCVPQKRMLKARVNAYNIVFYDTKDEKVRNLMNRLGHDTATPQVMIIEQGKKTAAWRGYTSWSKIEPRAKKAIKIKPDDVDVDDGKSVLYRMQERRQDRRDRLLDQLRDIRLGDRFDGLRQTLRGWYKGAVKLFEENGEAIVRIIIVLLMFL